VCPSWLVFFHVVSGRDDRMNDITLSSDHVYRVDGRVVESVTQAIGRAGLDPNKGFYNEAGARRGNEVHYMLELFDRMALDLRSVKPEYAGYIKAYNSFKNFSQPFWNLDGIEQTFYNATFNYCGTRDRIGSILWKGERVQCVLDLKTGAHCEWHGIQLAGYTLDHRYDRERFGLYITERGTHTLHHFTDDSDFDKFIKIL